MSLEARLAAGEVIILDGGTGTELERRGVPMHPVLWSGGAALDHGDVLEEIHVDYLRAGAEVLIANTFASGRHMLDAAGLGDRMDEINRASVERAIRARDRAAGDREVWVAGSISPMAPGADPAKRPGLDAAAASFREQAGILAAAGADLIILEMMRDVAHTEAAIEASVAMGLPVWIGFSCAWSAGREVVMAPAIIADLPLAEVVAPVMVRGGAVLAIMHSDLDITVPALDIARERWSGPLGAYPHSGHFVMPNWQFDSVISPEGYLAQAEAWVESGVQVVGGCCGIGPEHIRLLAERLPRRVPAAPAAGGDRA